jgi:hypothetical protein
MRSKVLDYAAYVRGLRAFLRAPVPSGAELERRLRTRHEGREERFLAVLEHGVYLSPRSPYRALLRHHGVELGDVQNLVAADGIEAAMARLYDDGFHVTLEEFKGRAPIERAGFSLDVRAEDFDNPLAARSYRALTGGPSRTGIASAWAFDQLRHELAYQWLFLRTFDALDRPLAVWRTVPPGRAALNNVFRSLKVGRVAERWFSQNPVRPGPGTLQNWTVLRTTLLLARAHGTPLPEPEHVPVEAAKRVAAWLAEKTAAGTPAILDTVSSSGVRACLAAEEHGLDVSGTLLRAGSEPLTRAKAQVAARVGMRAVCHYAFGEQGRIGTACAAPDARDDVHLHDDTVALVVRDQDVIGHAVPGLFFTTLLPSPPKLMLNTEIGDTAEIDDSDCGCPVGGFGLRRRLRNIHSYTKLTSGGTTFYGTEAVELLEEVLPRRFGGAPADYQLVEHETNHVVRVALLVSPRVGAVDEGELVRSVLDYLAKGPPFRAMMADSWRQGKTLHVVRREPFVTETAAKVLPLHVLERGREPASFD